MWNGTQMSVVRFRAELTRLIQAEIKMVEQHIVAGTLPNMREYRHRVGKIDAYVMVLSLFDDAEKKVNE